MWSGLRLALMCAMLGVCALPHEELGAAERRTAQGATAKSSATEKRTVRPGVRAVGGKNEAIRKASLRSAPQAHGDVRLDVRSGAALVAEPEGDAIYQKNADIVVPIASITKLMTAMVVLDGAPDLHGRIAISDDDIDMLRGSHSRLAVGTVLERETALLLALMSSENRAAHALARHYPGGIAAFVAAMNAKARALGMRDTRFEDPTGLTSNNVSTARDLAKLVAAAHRYPLIREFSTTPEATVEVSGRALEFRNTNPLVKSASWDVGLSKTGFISEAGKCLVMLARVADRPVVIVLLDSAGKMTRVGDANRIKRWMESAQLTHRPGAQATLSGARSGKRAG